MTGEQIREWRTRRGWTQDRLAAELGVAHDTVSRWENGAQEPSRMAVSLLVLRLGMVEVPA